MKATGIVRKVDELGRLVLPIEMRRTLGLNEKDPVEIFVEGESVVLRKYQATCIFCGSAEAGFEFKGKHICADCLKKIEEIP
jgi:transcriptional pleiotropic regulator of transition state genes